MIHVIAIFTTKPGLRAKVLAEIEAITNLVRAENGCLEYQTTIDSAESGDSHSKFGADTFVVVEKWSSMDALRTHANAAHMAAYGARVKGMMAARIVHVLSPSSE